MKVNVNLQPLNNWGTGISLFGNKLIEQLQENQNLELYGCFNFVRDIRREDLSRFPFPIKYSKVPYKLLYSRMFTRPLAMRYDKVMGNKADINLFFTYRIPRVKYSGLTVATIHDLIPLRVQQENDQIGLDYRNDISYAIKNSDYLITVSSASKSDIVQEFKFPEEKIFVVPNGVDYGSFNAPVPEQQLLEVRNKYNLPKKFILYFGNIRKHKNVSNLISAYSLLPEEMRNEINLVITQGNAELQRLAYDLKLQGQVHFTSFIDDEDKPALYKLAVSMVYISLYEGFGIPIIEAMAAGTPVITSSISSMPEVAGDAAILVDPLHTEDIASAMYRVIENLALRSEMTDRGYQNAQKYSWHNSGEKLGSLCTSLFKI